MTATQNTQDKTLTEEQYNNLITQRPHLKSYLQVEKHTKKPEQYTYSFSRDGEETHLNKFSKFDLSSIKLPDLTINGEEKDFTQVFNDEEIDIPKLVKTKQNLPLSSKNIINESNKLLSQNTHFEVDKEYEVLNKRVIDVFIGNDTEETSLTLKKGTKIKFTLLPTLPKMDYQSPNNVKNTYVKFEYLNQEYQCTMDKILPAIQNSQTGSGKKRTRRGISSGLIASKKRRRNSRKKQKNKSNLNFSTKKK